MPDLDITIGGRVFQVSCQPGEEHFLRAASAMLDSEAQPLVAAMGRLPESRLLLMSGLMLADKAAAIEDENRQLKAKLADIEAKKDALLTQFDDGDITARDYQKQLDALAKEERAVEMAKFEAGIAQKLEQQRLQNDWTNTCNQFVASHDVYKDNPRLYKALDAEVRDLASKPETANWTGQQFLEEAHKNLKTAFGFAEAEKPAGDKPADKRPPRDLPPNLAKVPAANVEDTNGGRFAVLDRLANTDPVAYEETLNKMSQAERDAYLNA